MKKNLLWLRPLVMLCSLFLLANCQNDDNIVSQTTQAQNGITQRIISLSDIKSMPGVMGKLSQFNLHSSKDATLTQKLVYNTKYDFTVDTDEVLLVQSGNYQSLSFPVYRDTDNGFVENLFLHPYNGGYLAFLFKYKFSAAQLDKVAKGTALTEAEIQNVMSFMPLDSYTTFDAGDPFMWNGVCSVFGESIYENGYLVGMTVIPCGNCECPGQGSSGSAVSAQPYSFTLSVATWGPSGTGGTSGPSPFNPGGGTGGGGGGTAPVPLPDIPYPTPITTPGHSLDNGNPIIGFLQPTHSQLVKFVQGLTTAQLNFWNDTANATVVNDIKEFLSENGYLNANKEWATQLINAMIDTGLSFDVGKSTVSPFNVDLSAVSGTTPEEIRFNQIYNALTTSPKFKELFSDVFQSSDQINVKFMIEDLPQSDSNQTLHGNSTLTTYTSGKLDSKIRINRSSLLTRPADLIAEIIIHECLHSFLDVKLKQPNIGMSILDINDMKFDACINTYYNGFSGSQTQHQFMVDYMVPSIVEILTDIKNQLYTPAQINSVENPTNGAAILHAPMLNSIPLVASAVEIPWNWNDYFTHLSFTGLQNCTSFIVFYPANSVAEYYRVKYVNAGNAMFTP